MLGAAIAARDHYPSLPRRAARPDRDRRPARSRRDPAARLRIRRRIAASQGTRGRRVARLGRACRLASPPSAATTVRCFIRSTARSTTSLLMDALERAVAATAAIKRVAAEVLSIDADQPSALTPTRGRFFATRLVLCTGAWAGRLPGLPRRIPVRPVRGQLLRLAQSPVRHVTYGGGGYLVPRGDTVLIGATSEEAGFENETSLGGLVRAAEHRLARDSGARQRPGGGPLGRAAPDVARHAPDPGSRSGVSRVGVCVRLLAKRHPLRALGGGPARRRAGRRPRPGAGPFPGRSASPDPRRRLTRPQPRAGRTDGPRPLARRRESGAEIVAAPSLARANPSCAIEGGYAHLLRPRVRPLPSR